MSIAAFLVSLSKTLAHFPWRNTAFALRQRFREDHLALTASSLTFTTMLSLVPMFTVALAVFTAFPMFSTVQLVLQKWLVSSLIPDNIARQVLGYLSQFSTKASKLGIVGLIAVLSTALALMLTIDSTLNEIWRVRKHRPLTQRILVYWAGLTLGPLVLGGSLSITTYVLSASSGVVGGGGVLAFALGLLEFVLLAAGLAALYRYVPHTEVKWTHAWSGGVFAAIAMEVAKKLLGWYLASVPTYSAVYGAFATFPILLLWVYVAWVIVLLGAVLAAYLPSLLAGVARRGGTPGWPFQLAIEVLQLLHARRGSAQPWLGRAGLAQQLKVDQVQLEPVLDLLVELDWVGQLEPIEQSPGARLVMLANPATTALRPLLESLLLQAESPLAAFWQHAKLAELSLQDALG